MATNVSSELERFYSFIAEKLANGGCQLSPEEALNEWRAENPCAGLVASILDLEQAIEEADRGEGIPLDKVIEQIRETHRFSSRALDE